MLKIVKSHICHSQWNWQCHSVAHHTVYAHYTIAHTQCVKEVHS